LKLKRYEMKIISDSDLL